jgi:hypothetical protein
MKFTLQQYKELKAAIIKSGYQSEIDWANNIKLPKDSVEFFCEYCWVVCNSGMKNQIAKKIHNRIIDALCDGKKAADVFGHKGKTTAIDQAWQNKYELFDKLLCCDTPEEVLAFCESLPFIGKITKYHLAKNCGTQIAKPDRWLVRVAKESGESVQGLCERISLESGDKVSVVDNVIWRACNLKLWDGNEII